MDKLNIEDVVNALRERFGESIEHADMAYDMMVVNVSKNHIHEALAFLKNHPVYQFTFLTTLCGLHFPDVQKLGVMYQLHNMVTNTRIRIKTLFADEPNAELPTVSDLFPTANWMERQEYDFFGIKFKGHPDLRRILNMDDLPMFPMRKEYQLEDATRTDKDDTMFGR